MGERHDAEHSVAKARQRLTEITEELSRRATGDYVKGRALEAKDRMTHRAKLEAREMTHRAKVEARERTFEMRDRMINSPWLLGLVGGAVGAIAGKKLGDKAKHSKLESGDYGRTYDQNYRGDYSGAYGRYYGQDYGQQDYGQSYGQNYDTAGYGYDERYAGSYDRPYDEYTATQQTTVAFVEPEAGLDLNQQSEGYASEGDSGSNLKEKVSGAAASAKEKVSEFGHQAKDKASHLKHRAQDKASHVKYRAQGKADEMKYRAKDFRERHASDSNSPGLRERLPSREQFRDTAHNVKARANDKPELFALGALAIGAIFGALMPLSRKEQQYLGPARAKAEGQIDNLKHQAMDKVRDVQHQVQKKAGIAGALLGASGSNKDQNEEQEERSSNVGGSEFHEDAGLQAGSSFGTTHVATYDAPAYGAESGSSDIDSRGTFTAGGEQQENREEGGTWTPTYDPDVTRH